MKNLIITLLLAVTVSMQAQTMGEFAVHTITLQLDAYQFSHELSKSGEYQVYTLVVPDFFDIHLVKSKINRLTDEYSDVDYIGAWKYRQDSESFMCTLNFADLTLTIGYHDGTKKLLVLYDKNKDYSTGN